MSEQSIDGDPVAVKQIIRATSRPLDSSEYREPMHLRDLAAQLGLPAGSRDLCKLSQELRYFGWRRGVRTGGGYLWWPPHALHALRPVPARDEGDGQG